MTIPQIYDRIEELPEMIHKNNQNQQYFIICEIELDAL